MSWKTTLLVLLVLSVFASPCLSLETDPIVEIGVRTLMESPEKHSQQVRVSGVVSQVVEEAKVIGLIDLEEFKTCNKVTCASLVLPVRWEGVLPKVEQQLTLTGKIHKEGERYIFIAEDLVVTSQNQ